MSGNAREMQDWLYDLLEEQMGGPDGEVASVSSYEEVGMLSGNRGLVVAMESGAVFQITIVRSN